MYIELVKKSAILQSFSFNMQYSDTCYNCITDKIKGENVFFNFQSFLRLTENIMTFKVSIWKFTQGIPFPSSARLAMALVILIIGKCHHQWLNWVS